ncbi:MAG: hypothetical protein KDC38_12110, partial [Planctomycetes bacterium]|nr:hypothetical protein [Planctomycetota bacterium]
MPFDDHRPSRRCGIIIRTVGLLSLLWSGATGLVAQTVDDIGYDIDGNRVATSSSIRFTSVGGFSVDPERAVPGDRINIYGRNFDTANPGQFAVSFAGEVGSVVHVSERVITVDLPATAVEGEIVLTLPSGTDVTVGSLTLQGVVISPAAVDLDYAQPFAFAAQVFGVPSPTVVWTVESLVAGADPGSISASGLYTAPPVETGAFPVLVRATSPELGQTAYALVRGSCSASTPLAFEALTDASFDAPFERDCFEFTGAAGQVISASYIGGPIARRFRILDAEGFPIGEANSGASVAIPGVLLPESGTYRVEVEAGDVEPGPYQVWVAVQSDLTPGRWIHPGPGSWHEASKWSSGIVPGAADDVVIPSYPTDFTVLVSSGTQLCASVVAEHPIRFTGTGVLTVQGTLTANAGVIMAGGTLSGAHIVAASGPGVTATASAGRLHAVTLGVPLLVDSGQTLRISGGLVIEGVTITLGSSTAGHSTIQLEGTQTLSGSGEIACVDSPIGYQRTLSVLGAAATVTIGAGILVHGADGLLSSSGTQSFVNLGTIRADVAGQKMRVDGLENFGLLEAPSGYLELDHVDGALGSATVTLGGTLDVDGAFTIDQSLVIRDASTLTLRGNWTNDSAIAMTGSTVNLGGTFTTTALGSFSRSGGTVNLIGTYDLGGGTLALNAITGDWRLAGGSLVNGTLDTSTGGTLIPTTS